MRSLLIKNLIVVKKTIKNKMIYFSDTTMVEFKGVFADVSTVMSQENRSNWMLSSNVTVTSEDITSNFLIHLWHNKNVHIMSTDHPMVTEVPDSDIRELSEWFLDHGWHRPGVHNHLLDDPRGFDFWMRLYRAGIVESPLLQQHENEEMDRFSEIIIKEEENEDANEN